MPRRLRLRVLSLLVLIALLPASASFALDAALWAGYKDAFVAKDGRVIDRYNAQVSHSEGQGYAMLLAVAHNDKETFDSAWRWTRDNIGVRPDDLFAWKWGKKADGQWAVIDYNNATDGDVLIAYALVKAFDKWKDGAYRGSALPIISGIRKNMPIDAGDRTFLLPSYFGFTREAGFVVNPSYLILPAFEAFKNIDDSAFWGKLRSDSEKFLTDACFGAMCLPPDWVIITDGKAVVWNERPPYFGAEAIRTLLHLSMTNPPRFPKGLDRILDYYEKNGYLPRWIDLENDSVSLKPAPAGYYAVAALAANKSGRLALGKKLAETAKEMLKNEKRDYYSFSLYLLSEAAGYL